MTFRRSIPRRSCVLEITTFNALRNSGARPGDVVAVLGIGGLGHLAIQYAARMGYHTVAIGRGADKADFARQLGAAVYIDNAAQDPAAELQKLGGAAVILATITSGDAMAAVQGGLKPWYARRHRRCAVDASFASRVDHGQSIGQGLVLGYIDRLARHADLQRSLALACGR
jgi:threonine dehydrogenase-like Zn-dependent dehydrogenase